MKNLLFLFLLVIQQLSFSQNNQRLCFVSSFTFSGKENVITVTINPSDESVRMGEIVYGSSKNPVVNCPSKAFYCVIKDTLVYLGDQPSAIDKKPDAYLSDYKLRFIHTDFFSCKPDEKNIILQSIDFYMLNGEDKTTNELNETHPQEMIFEIPADQESKRDNQNGEIVVDFAEVEPEFPGGEEAMAKFIRENLKYPSDQTEIQGSVYVQFIVHADGSITDISTLKSLNTPLDEEAMRVISIMPKWTPGAQGGKLVAVRYQIPIYFKIQ